MNKNTSPSLIEWYKDRSLKNRSGVSIKDILDADDEWMESNHSYIQWAFPNRIASIHNPTAPLLTDEFISELRGSVDMRLNYTDLYLRFLYFIESTTEWRQYYNHNHLRITRVITFLVEIGCASLAGFLDSRIKRLYNDINPTTLNYWNRALNEPNPQEYEKTKMSNM